jgi:hypothetical protein
MYSKRIYNGTRPEVRPFELHLGPYRDFALFLGVQAEHRTHDSPANLFQSCTVDVVGNTGAHNWTATGLHVEATVAGGSRDEREGWRILLRRADRGSSH